MRSYLYPGSLLVQAIRQQRMVRFDYHGQGRLVEPHIYGRVGNGHVILQGFQRANGSRSGKLPDWRSFHVADLRNVQLTDKTFHPEPGYNPDDPDFIEVFARIEWPALQY